MYVIAGRHVLQEAAEVVWGRVQNAPAGLPHRAGGGRQQRAQGSDGREHPGHLLLASLRPHDDRSAGKFTISSPPPPPPPSCVALVERLGDDSWQVVCAVCCHMALVFAMMDLYNIF